MALTVVVNTDEVAPEATAVAPLLERAVYAALLDAGLEDAEISLALLDDEAIASLNEEYLEHEGPTDVLSFALYGADEAPLGDVYVGYAQALRQAAQHDVPAEEELARLAIHGTLHVLGEDHPEGPERLESGMWARQERILDAVLGR